MHTKNHILLMHLDESVSAESFQAILDAMEEYAQQSKQSGGWVKASEPPKEPGRYFVKMSMQFIPANNESNQVATFTGTEWYLENHHHAHDKYWCKPDYWYDESAPSINEKLVEALRELVELKDIKDRIDAGQDPSIFTNMEDYSKRNPLAWQVAREIIKSIK